MTPQTTYALRDSAFSFVHTTTDPEEAQAWSEAGFRVTAETQGVPE